MSRLLTLAAAGFAAAIAAGLPAHAQPTAMRAEFTAPFTTHTEVIVDGRIWSCAGMACTTPNNDPRPAIACRKLARKVGPVVRFSAQQGELDTVGLAACNQDRK
jgi:hypothetical protein